MSLRIFLLLAAAAPGAALSADLDQNLQSCAAVADAAARLACYDALAHRAPALAAPSPAAPPAPAAAPAPAPAPAPEARFGTEGMSHPPAAEAPQDVSKIETHLAGSFNGWKPGTEFELTNGQVWKCTSDDSAYYPDIPDGPAVVIRRGFFTGSYWMEIAGVARKIKVRRLR